MSRWLAIMQIDDYGGEQHSYSDPDHAKEKVPERENFSGRLREFPSILTVPKVGESKKWRE